MPITIDGDGTITGLSAGGLPNDSVQLADMAHGTDGQIITYDASGAPVAVGPGTDGQVLTSTGAGSPPAFEALPASGKILQVVSANSDTNTQFTDQSSYGDHTNHTITITPTVSGSKIVLLAQFRFTIIRSNIETNSKWRLVLTIGSGSATYPLGADMNQTIEAGTSTNSRTSITVQVPVNYTTGATSNTTDAYVFKIQGKNGATSNSSESQAKYWRAIAMEVAA